MTDLKTLTVQKPKLKLRADNDKRHFVICPKCRSDLTNYISVLHKVSMFIGKKRIKLKSAVVKSKGLTLCRNCHYTEGSL